MCLFEVEVFEDITPTFNRSASTRRRSQGELPRGPVPKGIDEDFAAARWGASRRTCASLPVAGGHRGIPSAELAEGEGSVPANRSRGIMCGKICRVAPLGCPHARAVSLRGDRARLNRLRTVHRIVQPFFKRWSFFEAAYHLSTTGPGGPQGNPLIHHTSIQFSNGGKSDGGQ